MYKLSVQQQFVDAAKFSLRLLLIAYAIAKYLISVDAQNFVHQRNTKAILFVQSEK